jgi:hypothetical protein
VTTDVRTEMDALWYCGEVISPVELSVLAPQLERVSWRVQLRRSGRDGRDVLWARGGAVEVDMQGGQGTRKLFTGTVEAEPRSALRLLQELSDVFREAGMRHRIELYTAPDGPLLGYLHHDWPQPE